VELIGGGSNAWNSGDFLHYLYLPTPVVGDFDVAASVKRYDRSANQGGYSNSGLMLRASPYNAGQEYTADGTKVPMVANVTYLENSGPGRGSIPLWRTDVGGGYGNGNAGFSWTTFIGGIKGYYGALRAVDSVGTPDPDSSPDSARWLRIKRTGNDFAFYASWNGVTWSNVDNATIQLPTQLLLGFSTMTDSGSSTPPTSAYGNNGHTIEAADPLGPTALGGSAMNEANYAAEVIKIYPKTPAALLGPLSISLVGNKISVSWPAPGRLESAASLAGPWTLVSDTSNPYQVTPTGLATFYRLVP